MALKVKIDDDVPVARVFLSLHNPRHQPMETEGQAIERLCEQEDVHPLAKDIVQNGLSPLERFALVPIGPPERGAPTYYVAEGNRRICAILPDLRASASPPARAVFDAAMRCRRATQGLIRAAVARINPVLPS